MTGAGPKPIWLIMPSQTLVDLANDVVGKEPRYERLCRIQLADSVAGIPVAKYAIAQGAKAIISRGGTAKLIKESNRNFPVIEMATNLPLIMTKYFDLTRVHNDKKVVLFASSAFIPPKHQLDDFEQYGYEVHLIDELFGELNITAHADGVEIRDLKEDFKKLVADHSNKLFVYGDASACRLAAEYGVGFEEIRSSVGDVAQSIDSAIRLVRAAFVGISFSSPEVQIAHDKAMVPALERIGFNVLTQIDAKDPGSIMQKVLDDIRRSSLILIDLTGDRQNCYYELGYAHALGKNVIITAKVGTVLHFDVSGERCIFWSNWNELSTKLSKTLETLGYAF